MKMGDNLYCQAPQKDRSGKHFLQVVWIVCYISSLDLNIAHQDNFMVILDFTFSLYGEQRL